MRGNRVAPLVLSYHPNDCKAKGSLGPNPKIPHELPSGFVYSLWFYFSVKTLSNSSFAVAILSLSGTKDPKVQYSHLEGLLLSL